jgi:Na+/melibiose symporter-like transporter
MTIVQTVGMIAAAAVVPKAVQALGKKRAYIVSGAVAAAAGVATVSDDTESAVRVRAGRVVARADGFGACHAAASAA